MRKKTVIAEHLAVSGAVLVVMLGLVFSSFFFLDDILSRPQFYFDTSFTSEEIQFVLIRIALIVISVLVSYVVYLFLSSDTRAELLASHATKTLSVSLEQFEKLYEEAPVPYVIINTSGLILQPNKAALRFFGVVSEEIKNQNLFFYQPEEDQEKAEKFDRYYKSGLSINQEEVRMKTKNGDLKWASLSVFKVQNLGDYKNVGLATLVDITEQKKLDRAKTEFVSLASHQLRTPVSTIKWYTEMLLSGDLGEMSPKQKDYVNIVYKVNEDMVELINTLLNVSRIEIGTLKVEKTDTNVAELAESVLLELSAQIESKKLNIFRQYNGSLKKVENDPKLLRIVLQNLLSNAVKYTPEHGNIRIIFKESLLGKTIMIADSGVGIPEAEQDKIFTKMFRASNVYGGQGTGLGLYLVKSIVKTIGGEISFVSEENKGTTFTIKF